MPRGEWTMCAYLVQQDLTIVSLEHAIVYISIVLIDWVYSVDLCGIERTRRFVGAETTNLRAGTETIR